MNTDDYAPEIKRLIKEFVNDYLHSPEFLQQLESIMGEEEKYLTREELCRYARLVSTNSPASSVSPTYACNWMHLKTKSLN